MDEGEPAPDEHERVLRRRGAHRLVAEMRQRSRRFARTHAADLAAVDEQHRSTRMRTVHLLAVLVWAGTAVMIASELGRYTAGGQWARVGVGGACWSAALGAAAVIVSGRHPVSRIRGAAVLCSAIVALVCAVAAARGVSAGWSPLLYAGAGLVMLLCWVVLAVVRSRDRERAAIIDRNLAQVNRSLRDELRAELEQVPGRTDDGADLDPEAERARAALATALAERTVPAVPGEEWQAES